jgi:hypothetical protein
MTIVQVVPIGQENQRRIRHRRLFDDAARVKEHRQALAGTLRVPDDPDAAIAFRAEFMQPTSTLEMRS